MGSQQFATGMTSEDKAQLNRIETNTENIGSDKRTKHVVPFADHASNANVTLVDITGSGSLLGLNTQSTSSTYGTVVIVDGVNIDGTTSLTNGLMTSYLPQSGTFYIPFTTSLKVTIVGSGYGTQAHYELD